MGTENRREDKLNELFNELSECREDERNSQNQIVQVIVAAGTMLGVIFGASVFQDGLAEQNVIINPHSLLWFSSVIFCTAFTHITSLGIVNVLRFHYIQELEDRLSILIGRLEDEQEFMHWMSFSSPVTTRHPGHINNRYAMVHYASYTLSTMCAAVFCLSTMIIQYRNLLEKKSLDIISMNIAGVVMIFCIVCFFFISVDSNSMYKYAKKTSILKKSQRLNPSKTSPKINYGQIFLYFLYPKTKDIQKAGLILIGYIAGEILSGAVIFDNAMFWLPLRLILTIIVIEVLAYQARYQWNDIRGLSEDIKAKKAGRLPVMEMGNKAALRMSAITLAGRLWMAWYLIHRFGGDVKNILTVCVWGVIILSVLYEMSRALKFDMGVFILVSAGYPLRFLAGMWAAWPEMWNSDMKIQLILLLVAYGFLGEFSAVLPWTHEAVIQTAKGEILGKSHYKLLFEKSRERYEKARGRKDGEFFPMREKGKLSDIWNASFICGMTSLSMLLLSIYSAPKACLAEAAVLGISVFLCLSGQKSIIFTDMLLTTVTAVKFVYVFVNGSQPLVYYFVCVHQVLYGNIYFFLRYSFDPEFDMLKLCQQTVMKIWKVLTNIILRIVIGKETMEYIRKN